MGPPGCGKKTLVMQACEECDVPLVVLNIGTLLDPSPGAAELKLREAFLNTGLLEHRAILLNQLDILCPKRTDTTPSHSVRFTSQLLSLLENPQGPALIFATTTCPDAIDPSARRLGRIDQEIFIGPPTQQERANILKALFKVYLAYMYVLTVTRHGSRIFL